MPQTSPWDNEWRLTGVLLVIIGLLLLVLEGAVPLASHGPTEKSEPLTSIVFGLVIMLMGGIIVLKTKKR